jgi:hypothetical protein
MLIVEFMWPLRLSPASSAKSMWDRQQGLAAQFARAIDKPPLLFVTLGAYVLPLAAGGKDTGVAYGSSAIQSNGEGVLQVR